MKKKIPKTRYPWAIERWYAAAITKMAKEWARGAKIYVNFYIKRFVKGGTELKLDDASNDPDWFDKLNQQLQLMAFSIEQRSPDRNIQPLANRFVRALNGFSYNNVKAQTAIVGLDPISDNALLRNYVKGKIAENVNLIKSMKTNYFTSLEKDIYREITSGKGITAIAGDITKRTGMAAKHAQLIATDQTGTIISQFNSYRAQSAGAKKYIWQSMEDNRVRPKHQELDGTEQKYGDPNGGDDGQMPGEPIRCRCTALPEFDQ